MNACPPHEPRPSFRRRITADLTDLTDKEKDSNIICANPREPRYVAHGPNASSFLEVKAFREPSASVKKIVKIQFHRCFYPGGIPENSRWWSASGTTGRTREMHCTPAGVRENRAESKDRAHVLVAGTCLPVPSVTPASVKIPGGMVPLGAPPTGYFPESLRDRSEDGNLSAQLGSWVQYASGFRDAVAFHEPSPQPSPIRWERESEAVPGPNERPFGGGGFP